MKEVGKSVAGSCVCMCVRDIYMYVYVQYI